MTSDEEYRDGRWQSSVPLPLFCGVFVRCSCGRRFWGHAGMHRAAHRRYERHYRREHL